MKCHLVHLTGPRKGLAMSFESARITVGRAASCDLHFDPFEDLAVAPHHAEILLDEDRRYYVHDLGSRGGTYVNGERVRHRAALHPEDIIQFGENGPEMVFRLGMARPGHQPLPPDPLPVAELIFVTGADAGRTFPVPADTPTRIGRRADLEVALDPRGDLVVSGTHCIIEYWNGRFILTDTSRNGTFVNSQPVENQAVLQDGDEITLGESGPRAHLRIMPPRRIYPNLTARPTAPHPPAPEEKPEERFTDASAAEPEHIAHGTEDQEQAAAAEPAEAHAPHRPQAARIPAAPPQHKPHIPVRINLIRKRPAPIPRRRRTSLARRVALTVLFVVAVMIGFAVWQVIRGGKSAAPPSIAESILTQIAQGELHPARNGNFSVLVPKTWASYERGPGLMIEPSDSSLVVDYLRSPGLTRDAVRRLVSLDGAPVADLTGLAQAGEDAAVSGYVSKSGGTSRLAVLHEPPYDVPAVAMLEAPTGKFEQLPEQALASLLVDGVKLQQLAPRPRPTPTPAPTPAPVIASSTPAPEADPATTGPAVPGTTPSIPAVPPAEIAAATPAPSPVPGEQETTPTATAVPPAQVGRMLGVNLTVPEGWTGEEDAEEGIVILRAPSGFEMRISRDPERADVDEILKALEADGWVMTARPNVSDKFRAASMRKGNENAIFAFVFEPSGSTVVIYAPKSGNLTADERQAVSDVVGEFLTAAGP